jgi:chromate transporter
MLHFIVMRSDASTTGEEDASRSRDATPAHPVSFTRLLLYLLELGSLGFGGPVATVGYLQRDLVDTRRWLSRDDLLDGIALGQSMPGPLAAQVVMWIGYLRRGALGALAAAAAFVLPSFALVLAIGFLYVRFGGLPAVRSVFHGVAPAVIAIVALAAVRLARLTDGRDPRLWSISALVMVVTAVTGTEVAVLVLGAGLLMLAWDAPPSWLRRPGAGGLLATPFAGIGLGGLGSGVLVALFLFFLKAGAFIFGSGLAIVPFLHEGVVDQQRWLTERQFLDAVAVGLITPGPVVITAAFVGYLVAGLPGAAAASIGIFMPIYLGVVIPGRWFIRHRDDPRVRAFMRGATAAAAGAITGATVILARQAIVDVPTLLIALLSAVFLWRFRFRLKEPLLVVAAGLAGLALRGP